MISYIKHPSTWQRTRLALSLAVLAAVPTAALAQQDTTAAPIELEPITVTATRTPQQVFNTANPVFVIDTAGIRRQTPNTAADLFRSLPGLDITGVGPNQIRPIIRGQRGQRILLLENGLRLNNARRQQDFGELPALVDVNEIDRVEVVRGPLSVLYGTDAIGGAVNLIKRTYPSAADGGVHGQVSFLASGRDDQVRPNGAISWRGGKVGVQASATYRDAQAYTAPAGTFGDITLPTETTVFDTGVQDESYRLGLGIDLSERHAVYGEASYYQARDAGFGRIDEALFGPGTPLIQIVYPDQKVSRFTLGYDGKGLDWGIADRVGVKAYYGRNQRDLDFNVFVPFGPGAGLALTQDGFTDVKTAGARLEAMKVVGGRHLVTYGLDFFQDHSDNTLVSTTIFIGGGPPPSTDSTPSVPNATYRSTGAFVQGEFHLGDRFTTVLGLRGQEVRAKTRETQGLTEPQIESVDRTVVGSANLLFAVSRELNLIGAVGRGFRAPNIVELFFNGFTPEGQAFQQPNPDLKAETSVNVDVGFKWRRRNLYLEAFAYQNTIRNGIRIAATGDTTSTGFPVLQNVNVEQLRFRGVEVMAQVGLGAGFWVEGNYAHQSSKDVDDPANPVGDSYSDKVVGELSYRRPSGRFMLAYRIRHNGEQKDNVPAGSVIGPVLPAFTVHEVYGSLRLPDVARTRNTVSLTVRNLTNTLYAEFANTTGLFRPDPGRNVIVTWTTAF